MVEKREPKGHDPKEIWQRIMSENIFEVDIDADPKFVPYIYMTNLLMRTLSRIIAQGPFGPVTVKCTEDGSLAVVSRGGAFDAYIRLEKVFASWKDETTDATATNKLKDAGIDFDALGVTIGDIAINRTDDTHAIVTACNVDGELTLDADIFVSGELYSVVSPYEFEFTSRMSRIDMFTYNGLMDYQLRRDAGQSYGDKIELFEDSFYSLDINCTFIKVSPTTWDTTKAMKSRVMGWYRLGD